MLPMREAEFFWKRLQADQMPFGGFIVNRVHKFSHNMGEALMDQPAGGEICRGASIDRNLHEKLLTAYQHLVRQAESDAASIRRLVDKVCDPSEIKTIALADDAIMDLAGLYQLVSNLEAD